VSKKEEGKTVFRYNSENGITSLDPAFASTQDNIWAVNQIFNGLVQLDQNLVPQPCIAQSWNIDSSGKIYTFHLRQDVYFHPSPLFKPDDRKVTATDFVYSFNRITDPATASPGAWIFNDKIVSDGFRALNDSTFQIELVQPFAPFLGLLSMPYCMVVPREVTSKLGKAFAANPVGTGPFKHQLWEKDVNLVLHKNPNYFERLGADQLPYLDAINISFIANKQMALLKFLKGDLDLYNGVTSTTKDVILTKDGELKEDHTDHIYIEKKAFLNTEYLAVHLDSASVTWPWNNIDFRKAVNLAIDRNKMMSNLRNNIGFAADGGFIPVGLPGHSSDNAYEFNRERAKQLLRQSGYPDNPVPVRLTTTKDYLDLSIFIQKQLKDIGIDFYIEVLPSSELKEQKRSGNLAFFRASWIMDYPDAENYLSCFYSPNFSPGGPNYTHFKNAEFDNLYEQALTESSDGKRIRLYERMDSIVLNHAPIIVLFYDQSVRLLNKRVSNLNNNPLNIPTLKYARIED
jgi:peptide/nickel transport system substrate-binding protein